MTNKIMARKTYIDPPMKFNPGLKKYEVDLSAYEKKSRIPPGSQKYSVSIKIIIILITIIGLIFIGWLLFRVYEYLSFLGKFGLIE